MSVVRVVLDLHRVPHLVEQRVHRVARIAGLDVLAVEGDVAGLAVGRSRGQALEVAVAEVDRFVVVRRERVVADPGQRVQPLVRVEVVPAFAQLSGRHRVLRCRLLAASMDRKRQPSRKCGCRPPSVARRRALRALLASPRARLAHSAVIFASFTTLPHFCNSRSMYCASSSRVPGAGSRPCLASSAFTCGSFSAFTISRFQ